MDAEATSVGAVLRMQTRPKGETVVFGKLIAALSMMRGQPLVPFQIDVIEDRTAHIPLNVLVLAVKNILDAGGFRPDIEQLLAGCEKARVEIRAAMHFEPCANCSQQGWTEREIDGVKRMVRCDCWTRHQQKVEALGVGNVPLALPSGVPDEAA